ncbi:MAG: CAP domain-containing protein [Planctomycetaceae bacterium]|nr:CAP domain-containing protein [Planctomycetaceae bacterium]
MKRIFLAFVIFAMFGVICFGVELETGEREVIVKLNATRVKAGLCKLEVDDELVQDCRRWSDTLRSSKPRVVRGFFVYSVTRIWHASASERKGCAECVAFNNNISRNAFNQWRNSPPHWNVMMKRNINRIGVGRSGGYWTLRVRKEK